MRLACITLLCMLSAGVAASEAPALRVHFLGTGGPEITRSRFGAATLVEAGGELFLFDAGRGVLQRMGESRLDIPALRRVFFTHLHSDHLEGLPSLWMTSWFITKRSTPYAFWGPPGTQRAIAGMRQFLGHDVTARVNPVVQASGVEVTVTEIEEGIVFDEGGVRIEAIRASHGDGDPSFGYVLRHHGRSVLLTGDSTYTARFGEHVDEVDLIVCNVYAPSLELMATLDAHPEPVPTVVRAVAAKLASPEQAGRMMRETGARVGVFSHVIRYDSTPEQIIARTHDAGFEGPVVIADDRMRIDVGEDITVHPPAPVPEDLEINSLNWVDVLRP